MLDGKVESRLCCPVLVVMTDTIVRRSNGNHGGHSSTDCATDETTQPARDNVWHVHPINGGHNGRAGGQLVEKTPVIAAGEQGGHPPKVPTSCPFELVQIRTHSSEGACSASVKVPASVNARRPLWRCHSFRPGSIFNVAAVGGASYKWLRLH